MESPAKVIEIRPYTIKDLAIIYGVHRHTIRKWLERIKDQIGERYGYYYTIRQVRIIFRCLSLPSSVTLKDNFEDIWDAEEK